MTHHRPVTFFLSDKMDKRIITQSKESLQNLYPFAVWCNINLLLMSFCLFRPSPLCLKTMVHSSFNIDIVNPYLFFILSFADYDEIFSCYFIKVSVLNKGSQEMMKYSVVILSKFLSQKHEQSFL